MCDSAAGDPYMCGSADRVPVVSCSDSPTSGQLARDPGGGTSAAGRGPAPLPYSGIADEYRSSPRRRNDCTGGLEIGGPEIGGPEIGGLEIGGLETGGADAGGGTGNGSATEVTSGGAVGTRPGAIVYGRVTGWSLCERAGGALDGRPPMSGAPDTGDAAVGAPDVGYAGVRPGGGAGRDRTVGCAWTTGCTGVGIDAGGGAGIGAGGVCNGMGGGAGMCTGTGAGGAVCTGTGATGIGCCCTTVGCAGGTGRAAG